MLSTFVLKGLALLCNSLSIQNDSRWFCACKGRKSRMCSAAGSDTQHCGELLHSWQSESCDTNSRQSNWLADACLCEALCRAASASLSPLFPEYKLLECWQQTAPSQQVLVQEGTSLPSSRPASAHVRVIEIQRAQQQACREGRQQCITKLPTTSKPLQLSHAQCLIPTDSDCWRLLPLPKGGTDTLPSVEWASERSLIPQRSPVPRCTQPKHRAHTRQAS